MHVPAQGMKKQASDHDQSSAFGAIMRFHSILFYGLFVRTGTNLEKPGGIWGSDAYACMHVVVEFWILFSSCLS